MAEITSLVTGVVKNKNSILVINKQDLLPSASETDTYNIKLKGRLQALNINEDNLVQVSCRSGEGVEALVSKLTAKIKDQFELPRTCTEPLISRSRHRSNLQHCLQSLDRFLNCSLPEDMAAEELRHASISLGRITGRYDVEEILDVIFKDFCIGK